MDPKLKEALDLLKSASTDATVAAELRKLVPIGFEDAKKVVEDTEEGKKFLNSFADSRVTTGVQTALEKFKTKDMLAIIAENVKKAEADVTARLNPALTEDQKKMAQIEKDLAESKRDARLSKVEAHLTKIAADKGLPSTVVQFALTDDIDMATSRFNELAAFVESHSGEVVKKAVDTALLNNKHDPDKSGTKAVPTADVIKQLHDKAKASGSADDRVAYSLAKQAAQAAETAQ